MSETPNLSPEEAEALSAQQAQQQENAIRSLEHISMHLTGLQNLVNQHNALAKLNLEQKEQIARSDAVLAKAHAATMEYSNLMHKAQMECGAHVRPLTSADESGGTVSAIVARFEVCTVTYDETLQAWVENDSSNPVTIIGAVR